MARLVERLLTLARADHEAIRLERAPVALEPIVTEAVSLVQPLAVRRGITIETRLDTARVNGDRDCLTELVTNLCSNAVEYNREGGHVTVEVWPEGPDACMRVRDSGVGISEEDLPRIFERFYRPDKTRDRRTGGAGLGPRDREVDRRRARRPHHVPEHRRRRNRNARPPPAAGLSRSTASLDRTQPRGARPHGLVARPWPRCVSVSLWFVTGRRAYDSELRFQPCDERVELR